MKPVSPALWIAATLALLSTTQGGPPEIQPATDPRLRWWREARFGLFVHWGPVSLRGTEIGWSRGAEVAESDYDRLYRDFNPSRFDARAWARLAKEAGMKYLVLTTKHHDGFCLWDSALTDYDIAATPFGRDILRELARACRQEGLRFCAYHSICDWRHPDYPLGSPGGKSIKPQANMTRYNQYLKGQVEELIHLYGPLGILWFDGEWESPWTAEFGLDLYRHCRTLQPSILVNNRVGKARQGMEGTSAQGVFAGDYDTPEQRIGQFQTDRPWESCITLCRQWAWKPDDPMKSLAECIQTLVYCAGGDGNLLLNVGPMPSGEIEPRQAKRLRETGAWLRRYGQTIYQTRGGPFKPGSWGASTHRGRDVYVHVLRWEGGSMLTLPAIDARIVRSKLLSGGSLTVRQADANLVIEVPPADQQPIDTIIRLRLDRSASRLAP
jgi:alpha-L-fucosidase